MNNPISERLERKVSLFSVTNIVIASMIGAGIFTTSGLLMGDLEDPIVMLSLWVIGGIIALCGALSYGELGAAIPEAGGEYAFLSRLYHPVLGFMTGWVSLIAGFSAPIAASAIGFSEYLFRAFPFLSAAESTTLISVFWAKRLLAIVLIISFTAVHLKGIKFGTRVQNILTLLKVAVIVLLISLGLTLGNGSWEHLNSSTPFAFDLTGWKKAGLALMWIMFAYSGWNVATYIGSEIREPVKNLPRSLILGTGIVVILYFLLNVFYVYSTGPSEMSGVIAIGGLAVNNAFGSNLDTVVSLIIAVALFSSISAFIILGPRVYYAMARDKIFFRQLAEVGPRHHVPYKAIILQGLLAILMVLSGTFDQILTYMGFSLGIFPILAVFGVFKLRKEGKSVVQMPGFPFAPAFYLLAGSGILFLSFLERPFESSLAIFTVLAGLPLYFYFIRNRS